MGPIDFANLAGYIVSVLTPYLKNVVGEFTKNFGKEVSSKAVESLSSKNKELHNEIRQKFEEKTRLNELEEFEKNPDNKYVRAYIKETLKEFLEEDKQFAEGVLKTVGEEYKQSAISFSSNAQISGNAELVSSPIIAGENINIYYTNPAQTTREPIQAQLITPHQQKRRGQITILLQSKRFQKELELIVDKDTRVSSLLDLIVEKWDLPIERAIPEMMFTFSFRYQLAYNDERLKNFRTL